MSDLKHRSKDELISIIIYEESLIEIRNEEINRNKSLNSGAAERIKWARHYLAQKSQKSCGIALAVGGNCGDNLAATCFSCGGHSAPFDACPEYPEGKIQTMAVRSAKS